MPLRKKRRGFFFAQNSQKFTLFHKIYREKNIPFYEGNRECLRHAIPLILEVVACLKTNSKPDW
nr:MAG TPA: hypothetical protein [Caudoviricetes sp.]